MPKKKDFASQGFEEISRKAIRKTSHEHSKINIFGFQDSVTDERHLT